MREYFCLFILSEIFVSTFTSSIILIALSITSTASIPSFVAITYIPTTYQNRSKNEYHIYQTV